MIFRRRNACEWGVASLYEAMEVCMPAGVESFGGSVTVVMSSRRIALMIDAKFGGICPHKIISPTSPDHCDFNGIN